MATVTATSGGIKATSVIPDSLALDMAKNYYTIDLSNIPLAYQTRLVVSATYSGGTLYSYDTGYFTPNEPNRTQGSFTVGYDFWDAFPTSTSASIRFNAVLYSRFATGTPSSNTIFDKTYTVYLPQRAYPDAGEMYIHVGDDWIPYSSQTLVQHVSKVHILAGNNASSNVPFVSSSITFDGVTRSWPSSASSFFDGLTIEDHILNNYGQLQAKATVTDRRGLSATVTKTLNVQPYPKPQILNIDVKRTDIDGNVDVEGECAVATVNWSPSTSGEAATCSLKYRQVGHDDFLNCGEFLSGQPYLIEGNFNTDESYEFVATVSDKWAATQKSDILDTAYFTMDFKNGGKGIAFGRAATKDGFACAMDATFEGDFSATLKGSDLVDKSVTKAKLADHCVGQDQLESGVWNFIYQDGVGFSVLPSGTLCMTWKSNGRDYVVAFRVANVVNSISMTADGVDQWYVRPTG